MSLKTRALIAILLMFGFYVLSLAVAFGLLWIPYAEFVYLDKVHPRLALGCIAAALIVLWSIIPRRDRFQAPGPLINGSQHPRLFEELTSVAKATGQEMPKEVYLVPDVNAWVSQRGGVMGIGSRRVMGLGLPLMALLNVSQFRAVIAHEFGHYHAGDTKLGPWIYRTRAAIFRTVAELSKHNSLVMLLFEAYAKLYMRITLAISRSQEFAADRLSAQLTGARNLIEGLKQIHKGAVAWEPYLNTELGPMIDEGYGPPMAQGFVYFVQCPRIEPHTQASLEHELKEGRSDTYDSHPALPDRIKALEALGIDRGAEDTRPATALLENFEAADTELCQSAVTVAVKPVAWESAVESVWIPSWKRQLESQRRAFAPMVVGGLAKELNSGSFASRLIDPPGHLLDSEQRAAMAVGTSACVLGLVLRQNGWEVRGMPGELVCEKNGERVEPFEVTKQLASGEQTAEQWIAWCDKTELTSVPFVPNAASRTTGA